MSLLKPSSVNLEIAAQCLRNGDVVAIPTETVYGLAANAFNAEAVAKIFALKGRPATNPLITHYRDVTNVIDSTECNLTEIQSRRLHKLSQFWPGPLTIVLPRVAEIPHIVTAKLETMAVRVPAHPVATELLGLIDFPLAAPSANKSDYVSATKPEHVLSDFGEELRVILDGGDCQHGIESTVVSILDEKVQILRPGAITLANLEEALKEEVAFITDKADPKSSKPSPGLHEKHYAPRTPLRFLKESLNQPLPKAIGIISFGSTIPTFNDITRKEVRTLSANMELDDIAKALFSTLRDLDTLDLDLILIDSCPSEGIGMAIMDRLKRAMSS